MIWARLKQLRTRHSSLLCSVPMTEKTNFDETIIPEMQARKRKLDPEEGTNVSAKRTNVARAISAAGDSSSPQPTPSQPSVQSRCQSISVPDGTLSNCGRWYTVEDGPFKGIYRFKKDEAYVLQCSKKTRRMFEQQSPQVCGDSKKTRRMFE